MYTICSLTVTLAGDASALYCNLLHLLEALSRSQFDDQAGDSPQIVAVEACRLQPLLAVAFCEAANGLLAYYLFTTLELLSHALRFDSILLANLIRSGSG